MTSNKLKETSTSSLELYNIWTVVIVIPKQYIFNFVEYHKVLRYYYVSVDIFLLN